MATYPGGVYSPGTIGSTVTIEASHQNEPNDEIVAVQDALLNGISHDVLPSTTAEKDLGSATKTWAEVHANHVKSTGLNVTGASTLADLVVANLQVTGGSSGTQAQHEYARLYMSSNSSVVGTSELVVDFNTKVALSTSSWHSTTTNPSRLLLYSSGLYQITGNIAHSNLSAGAIRHVIELVLDSTEVIAKAGQLVQQNSTGHDMVSALYYASGTTSFVELRVRNVETANSTQRLVSNALSSFAPVLSAVKL